MNAKTPPLADGFPLVGSLVSLVSDAEAFFQAQYHKHGSCYRIRVLGSEFVVLGGGDAIEAMSKNAGEFDAWQVWEAIIKEFGGRVVLTMLEGERHQTYRKATRQGFAKSRVLENIPQVIELAKNSLLEKKPGEPFKLLEYIQRLVADSIGTMTLGRRPGHHLADFMLWWHTQLGVNLIGSKPKSVLEKAQYQNAKKSIRAFATEILADPNPAPYVLDMKNLMQAEPDLMNHEELLFMLLIPYVAGLDTVVNVVTLTLYELYKRPALLEQVRAEALPVLESGFPPEKMRDLKMLHATVLETMRYYTIANIPNRYAKEDFVFAGYQIKAGQKLMMHMNAASRDPKLFANPNAYDPERFLAPRNEHKQPGAMSPYGAGAHTCLGAGMAEALMALIVATFTTTGRLEIAPKNYTMKKFHSANLLADPNLKFVRLE
jgi:cytochrome P450